MISSKTLIKLIKLTFIYICDLVFQCNVNENEISIMLVMDQPLCYRTSYGFEIHSLDIVVMGRTPFYRTSNELKHHSLNIERTRTRSPIGDRTRTPYFWLGTNGHHTK